MSTGPIDFDHFRKHASSYEWWLIILAIFVFGLPCWLVVIDGGLRAGLMLAGAHLLLAAFIFLIRRITWGQLPMVFAGCALAFWVLFARLGVSPLFAAIAVTALLDQSGTFFQLRKALRPGELPA